MDTSGHGPLEMECHFELRPQPLCGGFYIVQCPILRIFVRFHLIFDQTKISDLNEIIHISGNIKSTKMADHLLEW